jgi:hypothetical protein
MIRTLVTKSLGRRPALECQAVPGEHRLPSRIWQSVGWNLVPTSHALGADARRVGVGTADTAMAHGSLEGPHSGECGYRLSTAGAAGFVAVRIRMSQQNAFVAGGARGSCDEFSLCPTSLCAG